MPGPPPEQTTKRAHLPGSVFDHERSRRQRARLALAQAIQLAAIERRQLARRGFAAADARRSEEHHRVANAFLPEAAMRLEVLGEDANRSRLVALEKIGEHVGQRLRGLRTTCTVSL